MVTIPPSKQNLDQNKPQQSAIPHKQQTLSKEQQKWIEKIATFDMEILHKRGKDNVFVDALSRKD